MDDGHPPTQPVQIELVCQGTVIQQVYTSGEGTFGLQINPGRGLFDRGRPMDASVSSTAPSSLGGGLGSNFGAGSGLARDSGFGHTESLNLSACELEAKLAGFESDRIILGPRRVLDSPDVGVLVLHSRAKAETATISLNTLAAPKDAKKAYDMAVKELGKKKINFSKATTELEKAVKIYPEFAAAWYLLGEISLELKDPPAARKSFEEAVAADPQYVNPYLSLVMLEMDEKHWDQAAELCRQALEIDPQLVKAHYFNALANSYLGELDAAEKSARQVQSSSQAQDYPLTHYVLGWIMSQRGDFHSAAAEYFHFLEIAPTAPIAEELKSQLAQWEEQSLIPASEMSGLED